MLRYTLFLVVFVSRCCSDHAERNNRRKTLVVQNRRASFAAKPPCPDKSVSFSFSNCLVFWSSRAMAASSRWRERESERSSALCEISMRFDVVSRTSSPADFDAFPLLHCLCSISDWKLNFWTSRFFSYFARNRASSTLPMRALLLLLLVISSLSSSSSSSLFIFIFFFFSEAAS